ncbi:MAG: PTS mannitol transporter subunit IICBA [Propionicimonas sp.]|uniref:PTS mannitol transporter subunit IICBA n=1 Tax=Propionicimonas sp. TaxID=1955623 RepID=UPI003D142CEA
MTTTTAVGPGSARVAVQRFGAFLSAMVMPNIGAFIAWGLITALFIKDGWINLLVPQPDDGWVAMLGGWGAFDGRGIVGPSITYLLPLLIGYTGGKLLHETRGGVAGAIATMGVITGTTVPMFLGAMIMGPLAGWTMKQLDARWEHRIRPGFEMLVGNFSVGIWGGVLAVFGFFVVGPVVAVVSNALSSAVGVLVASGLLPLTSILIEPGKVLFLNNAINHGILTPLGTEQAALTGKSVLFLLEANPGPGLGLLLAHMVFAKGTAKASAPGAAIIHFFGGIHEIYFPYVLMRPVLILAMIAGGMTGVFLNVAFGVGLRAPAAPGSVFAVYLQTAPDSYAGVTLAMAGSAAVSMVVASLLLGLDRRAEQTGADLAAAAARMEELKGRRSSVAGLLGGPTGPVSTIVFACDAGMGSSAMGASMLRRRIESAGISDVAVVNSSIGRLDATADLVVTQSRLTERARRRAPGAVHVSVDDFIASPAYDDIVALLREEAATRAVPAPPVVPAPAPVPEPDRAASLTLLSPTRVRIHAGPATRDAALREATELLIAAGAVTPAYYAAMQARERAVSTYMGHGLAIPHGTSELQNTVLGTAITFVRYDGGIDWDGHPVTFVVGIAGKGTEHLPLLARIAVIFSDAAEVDRLAAATTSAELFALLDAACAE